MAGLIKKRLIDSSICKENIYSDFSCTATQQFSLEAKSDDAFVFYSYRKRKDEARNAVFVKLNEKVLIVNTGDCPIIILHNKK